MTALTAFFRATVLAAGVGYASGAFAGTLPPGILHALPAGYSVLGYTTSSPDTAHTFYLVALASRTHLTHGRTSRAARPLLIFTRGSAGRYALAGRNDDVILRVDDGGINRCDPFDGRRIAAKGRYFTVENGVSCGAHWTDYVTFRFDARVHAYVFDNQRFQSWSPNPSNDPNAEALVSDGERVVLAKKGRQVSFSQWRRHD